MATAAEPVLDQRPPSQTCRAIKHIEVVVNPAAGSVGPDAAAEAERIIGDFGLSANITVLGHEDLPSLLRTAVDAGPDLLVVLAGDGTARGAASLCGAKGPLIAPLAGGTMNMLPHALYGKKDWKTALADTLAEGGEVTVSGGEVDGRRFYVAAILGAPALWAEAREAVRHGQLGLAVRKAHNAWRRAFSSKLRYELDGRKAGRAEALTLMCPLVSRILPVDERALEADALHPAGAAEAFRLGFRALFSEVVGDWRADPSVDVMRCRTGVAQARSHIPAILDGEPERLHRRAEIRFVPTAFRALAPPQQEATPAETP